MRRYMQSNHTDAARQRFSELLAKCAVIAGKPGGLLSEETEEFRRLAEQLGVTVTWSRFDLKTLDWAEGEKQ